MTVDKNAAKKQAPSDVPGINIRKKPLQKRNDLPWNQKSWRICCY